MTARNSKKSSKPMSDAIADTPAILLQDVALLATRSFATTDALIDAVFDLMARVVPNSVQFFARLTVPRSDTETPQFVIVCGRDHQGAPLPVGSVVDLPQTFALSSEAAPAPLIIDDIAADQHPLYRQWMPAKIQEHASLLGIPLVSRSGRVYGVLCAIGSSPLSPCDRPEQIALMQILAQLLMRHIEQSDLAQQVRVQETAARTSEEQFIATFEQAAVGIAHVRLDGRWLRVNQKLCAILGYTADELLACSFQDITYPPDLAASIASVEQMLTGSRASYTMEKRYIRKDQTLIWTNITVSLQRDSAGNPAYFITIIEDISERFRAEQALRESEERFRAAFAHARIGMSLTDLAGRFIQINAAYSTITGYSHEELSALDLITITHPDDRPHKLQQMQALIAGTIPGFVMKKRYVRKDGTVVWVQNSVSLMRDTQGNPLNMVVLTENISARIQAETERSQTLAQLEAVFATMTDGVFIYDAEGHIQIMNQAARDMLGIEEEPEHGQRSQTERSQRYQLRDEQGALLSRDRWPVTRLLRGERLSGNLAADIRVDTLDGRIIDLSFGGAPMYGPDGAIIGAVGVCRDVTDRRQLERKTQDALQSLLEMATAVVSPPAASPEGTTTDRRDVEQVLRLAQNMLSGRYVSIVRMTRTTGQLQPLAVVGLSPDAERQWWAELVDSQASTHIAPHLLDTLLREEPLIVDLAEQPPMTGRVYSYRQTVLSIAAPLSATDLCILSVEIHNHSDFTEADIALARGAAQLVTLILERERLLHDRTDAQARELALKQTNEQMLTFLGVASHELRTPMTSMKANVQLAERAVKSSLSTDIAPDAKRKLERAQTLLDSTRRQVDKLNRLITELLDVTRIDAGKLSIQCEPTDMAAVVADAIHHQRMAWPDREISFDTPTIPIIAEVDSARIEQVLTNFLTNALKYSAPDTSVAVSLTQRADVVHIAVSDHGPGIPPAALTHLWELFHQVEGITQLSGSGAGLGIGLYICKTIAERHGGSVGVESVVGQGSTFWCDVPLAGPATPPATADITGS